MVDGRGLARELSPLSRRSLLFAVGLVCFAMAWAPLFLTGFLGDDIEFLLRASGLFQAEQGELSASEVAPRSLLAMEPIEILGIVGDDVDGDVGSLLSGYSIALSLRVFGTRPESLFGLPTALFYRLENLALLAIASAGLASFLRRAFAPWTGREQAGAAAGTAAYLFFLHPLAIPGVAQLAGRSDLLALVFSTWAAAAFLRGRQDRSRDWVALSLGLAFLAGLSGQLAWVLPFAIGMSELACSYRYRKLSHRWRTAVNSFVAFFAVVLLNTAVVSAVTGHGYYPRFGITIGRLAEPGALFHAIFGTAEKLGALFLPANLATLGILGFVIAGAILLGAFQPAFVAARSAPRLWGWTAAWWIGSVLVALMFGLHERVSLETLASGRTLLPAAAAMCAGLGLACTAVHGLRRYALPPALAIGFAVLSSGNAQPWKEASERLEGLKSDVLYARKAFGPQTPLIVVGAPRDVLGLDPLGAALPDLLHPLFADRDAPLSETAMRLDARDLPRPGLELLLGLPDVEELIDERTQVGLPIDSEGAERAAHAFVSWNDVRADYDAPASRESRVTMAPMRRFGSLEMSWTRSAESEADDSRVARLGLLDVHSFAYREFNNAAWPSPVDGRFRGVAPFLRSLLEPPVDPRRPVPEPDLRYEGRLDAPPALRPVLRGQVSPNVYQALR